MSPNYRRKILAWISSWERRGYADGLPDEAPETLESIGRVPSYRLICVAIMKNDHTLEMLGYSRPKCELYNDLKRTEIAACRTKQGQQAARRAVQYFLPGAR